MKTNVKKLVLAAILTALSIVLSRFLGFYLTETVRVSLGSLPILLAGIWLGPLYGAVVGGAADILGAALFSGLGIYFPLTVGPVLVGLTAGIMAKYFLKGGTIGRVALVCAAADIAGSVLYTSFALSMLYGIGYGVTLLGRLPVNAGLCVVETLLIFVLNKRLGGKVPV